MPQEEDSERPVSSLSLVELFEGAEDAARRPRLSKTQRRETDTLTTPGECLDFLASTTRLLVSSLDYQATLDQVARLAVPRMADFCLVDIAEEGGGFKRLAVGHARPDHAHLARRLSRRYSMSPNGEAFIPRAIRTKEAQLYEKVPDDFLLDILREEDIFHSFREAGVVSAICAPLVVRAQVLGAITMFTGDSGRMYGSEDLALVTEIANGAALVIDNARLFREAQQAVVRKDETLALLDTFLAKTPVAIAFLDLDRRFILVNQCMASLSGKTSREHVGHRFQDVLPLAAGFLEPMFEAVLDSGEPIVDVEFSGDDVPLPGGHLSFGLASIYPVALRDNTLGIGVVLRDITPAKQLELELRKRVNELADADSRKDEFLAMLAHELRNPLGAIAFAIQGLEVIAASGEPDGAKAHQFRSAIKRQTQELARLVDDLLDVSRITRGKIQLRKSVVDLVEVLRHAIRIYRPVVEAAQQRLDVILPLDRISMIADSARLEQLIGNLIDNAVKYTPPGGMIRVSLAREYRSDGLYAVLKVSDSGVGIVPELLPHVFELFTQAEQSLDRARGGLGIGLTIVQRIAVLHGGSVSAHSAGRGEGSEFVINLPALYSDGEVMNSPKSAPAPNQQEARRVLIVEDNTDMREALRELLELWGHVVFEASDGAEGLELALSSRPDVALVDIGLPRMDGYSVAQKIRELEPEREVYLVAMTGYGRPEDRLRALEAGFDTHLVKPVDGDQLVNVLSKTAKRS